MCIRDSPGAVLEIPHGVYHFYEAPGDVFLPVHGLHDLTVEGNGSELIFHSPVAYWDIADSSRVHLKNMVLDWAWDDAPPVSYTHLGCGRRQRPRYGGGFLYHVG